ncbi:MAG: queuosine precursor transporter [Cohaesibacter sp.]|jgi:uncharacterized PurR-regulated membrane protein YhhQ (DUF165 family)|nr:queuosine precursor transporter [Cohaesibacter sp.]
MVATRTGLIIGILAMAITVVASNYLVQFPFEPLGLQDLLTWGAFTYPVAFLVTDLTNRRFGPAAARKVVFVGFALAVLWSIWVASPRIAIASGTAFLTAQLLDVFVFNKLRQTRWWQAPLVSSFLGSSLDTLLFFGMAFATSFAFLDTSFGMEADAFPAGMAPFLYIESLQAPRWVSWAVGDYGVKLLVSLAMLAPYKLLRSRADDFSAARA